MNFNYKVYGLRVSSQRPVSLLNRTDDTVTDLQVHWADAASLNTQHQHLLWEQVQTADLLQRRHIKFFVSTTPTGTYYKTLYNTPDGDFYFILSPAKKELWIVYDQKVPPSNLESFFVGPVMGSVLRLRDIVCLHASVVEINGKAIAFLGVKRSGKSTTAAAFARLGYRVLADDLAVITEFNGNFYVEPGYSKLRLRTKTAEEIHKEDLLSLPMVYSYGESFYSTLSKQFCDTRLPLAAIYSFTPTETNHKEPFITPVSLPGRLPILGRNTFGNYVLTPATRKKEFDILCRMAMNIPVNKLHLVYAIENLDRQCEVVLENLKQLTHQTTNLPVDEF